MTIVNKKGAPWRAVVRTEKLEDGRRYDVLECGHREIGDYSMTKKPKRRCRTCKDPSFVGISIQPHKPTPVVDVAAKPNGTPRPPLRLPAFLTIDEVAELLRLNRKTVYAAVVCGEIPGGRKIGRVIRVSSRLLLDWFDPLPPG